MSSKSCNLIKNIPLLFTTLSLFIISNCCAPAPKAPLHNKKDKSYENYCHTILNYGFIDGQEKLNNPNNPDFFKISIAIQTNLHLLFNNTISEATRLHQYKTFYLDKIKTALLECINQRKACHPQLNPSQDDANPTIGSWIDAITEIAYQVIDAQQLLTKIDAQPIATLIALNHWLYFYLIDFINIATDHNLQCDHIFNKQLAIDRLKFLSAYQKLTTSLICENQILNKPNPTTITYFMDEHDERLSLWIMIQCTSLLEVPTEQKPFIIECNAAIENIFQTCNHRLIQWMNKLLPNIVNTTTPCEMSNFIKAIQLELSHFLKTQPAESIGHATCFIHQELDLWTQKLNGWLNEFLMKIKARGNPTLWNKEDIKQDISQLQTILNQQVNGQNNHTYTHTLGTALQNGGNNFIKETLHAIEHFETECSMPVQKLDLNHKVQEMWIDRLGFIDVIQSWLKLYTLIAQHKPNFYYNFESHTIRSKNKHFIDTLTQIAEKQLHLWLCIQISNNILQRSDGLEWQTWLSFAERFNLQILDIITLQEQLMELTNRLSTRSNLEEMLLLKELNQKVFDQVSIPIISWLAAMSIGFSIFDPKHDQAEQTANLLKKLCPEYHFTTEISQIILKAAIVPTISSVLNVALPLLLKFEADLLKQVPYTLKQLKLKNLSIKTLARFLSMHSVIVKENNLQSNALICCNPLFTLCKNHLITKKLALTITEETSCRDSIRQMEETAIYALKHLNNNALIMMQKESTKTQQEQRSLIQQEENTELTKLLELHRNAILNIKINQLIESVHAEATKSYLELWQQLQALSAANQPWRRNWYTRYRYLKTQADGPKPITKIPHLL